MAGSFGTNYAYGVGDALNIVSTNVAGTAGALRTITYSPNTLSAGTSTQVAAVMHPAGTPFVLHSVTTIGSGATGTTTGTITSGLAQWKNIDIFIDVTAETGAATTTLLVFVDGQHPTGSVTLSIAQYAAITTVGQHVIHLSKERAAGSTAAVQVDAGAGTVRAIGWGDALRIRTQLTGTDTTTVSATIYVSNQVA